MDKKNTSSIRDFGSHSTLVASFEFFASSRAGSYNTKEFVA
jgi:hypothetical protein